MDGLKVERKIERGERRGTRVGTLAAAVRDTLGVEGGRTNCSLTRSLSRSIERGDIGRKGDSWTMVVTIGLSGEFADADVFNASGKCSLSRKISF